MTDIQRFIELYKSFGIELTAEPTKQGYEVLLDADSHDKFGGYRGFGYVVEFSADGAFLKQSFWE